MNCNELRDSYELYAIGVADDPERSEIREHLNRECEVCMQGIRQARELAALLGGTAAPAAPSPKLRGRILASVGVEQRRFGLAPWLAAALAMSMFAVVYFVGQWKNAMDQYAQVRAELRTQTIELSRLNEAFAIVNSSDSTVSDFGGAQTQPPKGKVIMSKSQGLLLIANNLPPAGAGKAYEMWIIPKGGKPKPAGMFHAAPNGSAMHMMHEAIAPDSLVAVTIEPEAGSDQPTSQPLFAAPIKGL